MERIDGALLRRIQDLARLRLGPGEEARLGEDLERILGFVGALETVGATGETGPEAGAAPVRSGRGPRADAVGGTAPPGALLDGAPETEDGCFAVPPAVPAPGTDG